ncbi:hypothetical protein GHT09_009867 [Marmota monax]|uniref:Scaffolding anchor of CK1 domain-containing protein n=1 Tax=Marmota monax TaxID=9995 RepID=A0A834V0A8_MARMO|nr:hypothetical protein GHT09_009867 [Marmota monax]
MAFSQVQCLDDSHVNWRSSESKPEFFYSEEQRLALEALVARGPEAFYEVLKRENIRDFLSELELKRILETIEVYDPGSEDPRGSGRSQGPQVNGVGDGEETSGADGTPTEAEPLPLPSLEYWPQKSDRSIPQLDLGWPDTIAYRGVTRASVYMQPPIDGQAHIKEVVRKMISQAQKVIAVVMDMFTDVDIFKDLLDAGFKRKVAVYIILDESNVKYFLHMCERARMHLGHLKSFRPVIGAQIDAGGWAALGWLPRSRAPGLLTLSPTPARCVISAVIPLWWHIAHARVTVWKKRVWELDRRGSSPSCTQEETLAEPHAHMHLPHAQ